MISRGLFLQLRFSHHIQLRDTKMYRPQWFGGRIQASDSDGPSLNLMGRIFSGSPGSIPGNIITCKFFDVMNKKQRSCNGLEGGGVRGAGGALFCVLIRWVRTEHGL
jgi:hypothetical protein